MANIEAAIAAEYSAQEPRAIEVPEWADIGAGTIYVWPETIGQMAKLAESENEYIYAVNAIVIRAKDRDGRRIFSDAMRDEIIARGVGRFGPAVIARVAADIMADRTEALAPKVEAAEKK
ncbi:MAG: hypothetical protein D6744_02870 [Planctomycetota bacterium]|nr:MAG: hypothetical protein D6744_02870 [Planctomycetota bacterium]